MQLKLTPNLNAAAATPWPNRAASGRVGVTGAVGGGAAGGATNRANATGFGSELKNALNEVSRMQNDATRLQREVQLENPQVSLEETMLAIQKAQIGFQATLHVRNRMVQAYTDIMNMQV